MSVDLATADLPLAADLPVVDRISGDEFLNEYIRKCQPVVMRRMMDDWPAMERWSFEFFRDLNLQSTVHLEEGNVMQHQTGFRKATFTEYVQQLIDAIDDYDYDGDGDGDGDSDGAGDASTRQAYLSVFRIFDVLPELREDVNFDILNQFKLKHSTVGWLGPRGSVTGYHIDWGDNILAQICGRKCLHLVPPSETHNMYVSRKFDQGTTISDVDLDNVDHDRFPRFSKVRHHRVVLNPGEMIFIPRSWWHHVRSLDKSISVSNLTFDGRGLALDAVPHRIKQILHNWGLWRCECTCHIVRDGQWVRK